MNLEIPNLLCTGHTKVEEMTMSDLRSISFMIENDSDESFYKFIKSKISTKSCGVDVLNALLEARSKYVDHILTFNNGTSNISIDIDNWIAVFRSKIKSIRTTLQFGSIMITVDYPDDVYFSSVDEVLEKTIKRIEIGEQGIDFSTLVDDDRREVMHKLPMGAIKMVEDFISANEENIVLFESRLGLPEMHINFFNNSAYSVLKTIYSYYTTEYISELLFSMSRRINDISYLNSITPKEFTLILKLYEEEIEKLNQSTN